MSTAAPEQKFVIRRKVFDRQSLFFIGLHLLLTGAVVAVLLGPARSAAPGAGEDGESERELGNRLKAAGLPGEAIGAYTRYLAAAHLPAPERAKMAFTVAELARELGRYEQALAYYYQVEIADPGSPLKAEVGPKIVACLERLGKVSAADQALSSRAGRDPAKVGQAAQVVAKIGSDEITLADIDAAMEVLPPQLAAEFNSKDKKQEFVKRYVAEELLYRKAKKLELDKEPGVRRQIDQVGRQLVVSRLVEREVVGKLKLDASDLSNYFKANQSRFGKKKFEEAKAEVERAYRNEKIGAGYQSMVEEALKGAEVKLFPEAVGGR